MTGNIALTASIVEGISLVWVVAQLWAIRSELAKLETDVGILALQMEAIGAALCDILNDLDGRGKIANVGDSDQWDEDEGDECSTSTLLGTLLETLLETPEA